MSKIRAALAAAAVALAVGVPATAADPAAGTIVEGTPEQQRVFWNGSFPTDYINPLLLISPVPELRCLQPGACDEFKLTVALGDGYWETNGDGALEVAIRWIYDGITDLDLQVLDAQGDVVAASAAVDSNAESVFISNAPDGAYIVRIIPSNTFNPESTADMVLYEGMAQVEILASDPPGEGHAMLPNLRPAPPDGFHIASALNLIPFPENPLLSCYPEETIQNQGHPTRCLRFNQTIANVGMPTDVPGVLTEVGPMVMRFGLSGIATPDTSDNVIVQRIYSTDGTFEDVVAPETYVFHEAHAHLHYQGFGQTILYNWSGGVRGTVASIGHKVGFCMIDVELQDEYWGKTGNGPRAHTFPLSCVLPEEVDLEGPEVWVEQGVAAGWADIYGWNLADQYIDITNVSDGTYELVQIANPNNSVREIPGGEIDNCSSRVIRIKGDTVEPVTAGSAVTCPSE